jgi:hypothetical protein
METIEDTAMYKKADIIEALGHVIRPRGLTYQEITEMPAEEVRAALNAWGFDLEAYDKMVLQRMARKAKDVQGTEHAKCRNLKTVQYKIVK